MVKPYCSNFKIIKAFFSVSKFLGVLQWVYHDKHTCDRKRGGGAGRYQGEGGGVEEKQVDEWNCLRSASQWNR